MAETPAVQTRELTRSFGGARPACDRISLSVAAGGIFGLLGCNGAGKSTFVKMLVGLIRPTSGEARVFGLRPDLRQTRHLFGFLPENFRYPPWATGVEVLGFHAKLAGMAPVRRRARIADALERVGLGEDGGRLVRAYSKGMQQRLGLACALLADPPLLFLDEPTSALDPLGRRQVREILLGLRAEGKTVFLNSHLLSELELVCDRVAFIGGGRLSASGSLAELLDTGLEVEFVIHQQDRAAEEALAAFGPIVGRADDGRGYRRLRMALTRREDVPDAVAAVVAAGGRLFGVQAHVRTLEDVFVDLALDGAGPGRLPRVREASPVGAAAGGARRDG